MDKCKIIHSSLSLRALVSILRFPPILILVWLLSEEYTRQDACPGVHQANPVGDKVFLENTKCIDHIFDIDDISHLYFAPFHKVYKLEH